MNQQKLNAAIAAMAKLAKRPVKKVKSTVYVGGERLQNTERVLKKNKLATKAKKQQAKNKQSRNRTPSPKAKEKSMAQKKRNLRLLLK